MSTTLSLVTPEDLLHMGDEGKGYELVKGELKKMDVSARSSRIGGQIYRLLENYSRTQEPGWVFPPETGFQCFAKEPNQVRKPDAAYIKLDRFTRQEYEEAGFIEVVPDLVTEVVSPNDKAEYLGNKIKDWLSAGVKIVWEVYPDLRQIREHRSGETIQVFRSQDTLTAPDLLPGFTCPVAELFQLPGEPIPST